MFYGTKGYYRIPNKCVPQNRCSAAATGYIDGNLPTIYDGIVKRKVCFHSNGNCCHFSTYIYVRNCYLFYVYKLKKLNLSWSARHCAEHYVNGEQSNTIESAYQTFVFHINVFLLFPQIENPSRIFQGYPQPLVLYNHVIHRLYQVTDDLICMRYCTLDTTCKTFNYNLNMSTCELNNATAEEYPHHLKPRPGYKYFYEVKLNMIASTSSAGEF
jgi:hypothetical protein